ncbi:RNA polymerase II transcription initiation/nucleotide excision repair factor TFIIH, subunit SSL1 [Pseudoloma neurophilia]|uniref:RNA polymerase II transcription initiation/nucleotide excision repair factor TFIIH, subunit SSL1 n=1 Tax=Pseudoloma neurophilia TaxID=146866 RepID=A0A0R0M1R1_9MICR|nr:RNA polymerase II transcription initiation/nucleotide excision repair factor TFIIH, subunit SSL1 [Pseudoloma neurophilia]
MSNPFSWEKSYKRTWEDLETDNETVRKRQKILNNSYKKGIIRHFHIIVDYSESIELNDFLPSIRYNITESLKIFKKKFYSENPISILSILIYRNNRTEKYCILDNNTDIDKLFDKSGTGDFSLVESLKSSLKFISNDYIKEILVITGSIFTVGCSNNHNLNQQNENIENSIEGLENIKVHFISIRGAVHFFEEISKKTGGQYHVPIDLNDITYYLSLFTVPSSVNTSSTVNLLRLGFPEIIYDTLYCTCCFKKRNILYDCPICHSGYCQLPTKCIICDTQLVVNSTLVQSLYFCYPLEKFVESLNSTCRICQKDSTSKCTKCGSDYCQTCDQFLHNDVCYCVYCL